MMQTERGKPKKRPRTKKENRIDSNFCEEHAKLDKTKSACMRTHKTTKLQQHTSNGGDDDDEDDDTKQTENYYG
jgi:hypothetical protein